jgi:hypothetical protein
MIVTNAQDKVVREIAAPGNAGVIQRVNWDLRYPLPAGAGRGGGGGGGEEGGGGGPGTQRAGVIQLPVPSHDIGPRGPHIAPGTFTVTLEVDGAASGSKTFSVRADPASAVTLTQHKAREAFVVEVMALQARVDRLAAELRTKGTGATGDAAAKLQALTQRLGGAAGGGRGGAGRGGPQPVRQRLAGLTNPYIGSGARTGTLTPPTGAMLAALAEARSDLAAIEKEIQALK